MKRILITGTGRAGTTLLVQVLTALGFDTGYTMDKALSSVDAIGRAGLEPNLQKDRLAQVFKAPGQPDQIQRLLQQQGFELEAAILPMRELFAAAESRRHVYEQAKATGNNPLKQAGSLWGTKDPDQQETSLALQFYRCLQPIVASGAPVYLLDFPRFATDPAYLYASLRPLFEARGLSELNVAGALMKVGRPELINNFQDGQRRNIAPADASGRRRLRWF